jgi:hypothetical protein
MSSSRAAARSNSILHAMVAVEVAQPNRLAPAVAEVLEADLGEIEVLVFG